MVHTSRALTFGMVLLGLALTGCGGPPRYDQVMQKATHNSYVRGSSLFDQLVYHRIRSFELDVWTHTAGFPVYHNEHGGSTDDSNCQSLSECVDVLRAFHDATPEHEVVTVWIEPTDYQDAGPGHGRFPTAAFEQLIAKLPLWRPADLMTNCPRAVSHDPKRKPMLFDASRQCGFPETDALRGKFIFVLMDADPSKEIFALTDYVGPGDGSDRLMFVAPRPEHLDAMGPAISVFLNDYKPPVEAGRVSRLNLSKKCGSASDWSGYASSGIQHVANDCENWLVPNRPVTHNAQGWPFQCLHGGCGGKVEPTDLIGLKSQSGDLEGPSDSFSFAYEAHLPADETRLSAFISAPSSRVERWAKGCLMMRESESANSAYYAVCRTADGRTVRTQARSVTGGATKSTELSLDAERTGVFVELSAIRRGTTTCFRHGVSTNGTSWNRTAKADCIEGWFPYQGVAVSSHGDAPVHFLFGNLKRSSTENPPTIEPFSASDLDLVAIGAVAQQSLFEGPIPP